jgi:PAS domain S-box-containing protein
MFPSGERERELYRLALETTLGGLWDWEVDSGRVQFSRSWAEMLGETRVEPSYRSWESRLHPDDRDRALTALNRHLEGKTDIFACEYRLRTADGSWKWVYARGRVVQRDDAGNPLRVTGATMDIDRWKRTEQEARTHREQYRRLLESSADLLFSLDRHGVVRSAGGWRLRELGHAPESLVGQPLSLLFPEHHGFYLDRSRRVLESGSPITCTHAYLRDGERRTDQSTLYPVTGADGRVEQVGVICRDITGELRTREELQKREEWLQALYDSSPDPIAVIDEDGIFID